MDIELQNSQDMEIAMSLARVCEQCLVVIVDSNKEPITKPAPRVLPLKAPPSTPTPTTMTTTSLTAPPCPFKHLTAEEMAERRCSRLYFNCDKPFAHGHKCKHLFDIMAVNDYDNNDDDANIDNSLLMMIGTDQSLVLGHPPMYLTRVVTETGIHILVDMGSTHNIIDINVTRLIGL